MTGRQLGVYRLDALIGRGGMGEVYRAYDTRRERVVALKVLASHVDADPAFAYRFEREARITARLSEPHIVPIHDFGQIDGQYFIDMRLVVGSSLRDELTAQGALPAERAVAIVAQVASALDAAHAAGLVHRDVKPDNVLLGANDFAYLVDFGIAVDSLSTRLTSTGMTIGTLAYMAPERLKGADPAAAADLYSLALLLRECVTGNPPRLHEPDPGVDVLDPRLQAVIRRGLAVDPGARYASAGALAVAAQDAVHGSGATRGLAPGAEATATARLPQPPGAAVEPPTAEPARSADWARSADAASREQAEPRDVRRAAAGVRPRPDRLGADPRRARRSIAALVGAALVAVVALGVVWFWLDPFGPDPSDPTASGTGRSLLPTQAGSTSGQPRAVTRGDVTTVTLAAGQKVWFTSGTGRTACRMAPEGVRCISPVRRYSVPSEVPDRCAGSLVLASRASEPRFSCAGTEEFARASAPATSWAQRRVAVGELGTVMPVLENGHTIVAGFFQCEMTPDYVRCNDTTSGGSFRIARSTYTVHPGDGLPTVD